MQKASISVCVKVQLTTPARQMHRDQMHVVATQLTDNKNSIRTSLIPEAPHTLLVEFTLKRGRQMDVVEVIRKAFSRKIEDYSTQTLWFPKR